VFWSYKIIFLLESKNETTMRRQKSILQAPLAYGNYEDDMYGGALVGGKRIYANPNPMPAELIQPQGRRPNREESAKNRRYKRDVQDQAVAKSIRAQAQGSLDFADDLAAELAEELSSFSIPIPKAKLAKSQMDVLKKEAKTRARVGYIKARFVRDNGRRISSLADWQQAVRNYSNDYKVLYAAAETGNANAEAKVADALAFDLKESLYDSTARDSTGKRVYNKRWASSSNVGLPSVL
jgi:hypothetical protein